MSTLVQKRKYRRRRKHTPRAKAHILGSPMKPKAEALGYLSLSVEVLCWFEESGRAVRAMPTLTTMKPS